MSRDEGHHERHESFSEEILKIEKRKLKERHNQKNSWFGLGMMGVIGWTIALPTVAGLGAGLWLDNRNPGSMSWTLMGLGAGVMVGCIMAWSWIKREQEDTDDDID